MRILVAATITVLVLSGCVAGPDWPAAPGPVGQPVVVVPQNPIFIPSRNPECVWETMVDVLDDYFRIEHEEPVRLVGSTLTEGRLETFPEVGATIFEPWRDDSVGAYERLESTLQSLRRRAVVRVIPGEGGYWIDVAVFKELEDVARPEHSTAGAATFQYDDSLVRVVNPDLNQSPTLGWIPQGRDGLLEQRILAQLQSRLCGATR